MPKDRSVIEHSDVGMRNREGSDKRWHGEKKRET